MGLFTEAIPAVDASRAASAMPHADAKVSYTLQMLRDRLDRCSPVEVRASLDGEDVSGAYILFEAMIMPYIGPNLYLAPDAQMGDGCFDLVLATVHECERVARYLESWQDGKPRLPVLPTRRGRHLRIEGSAERLHLDDELWPPDRDARPSGGSIELSMEEGAVELLVPVR